MDDADSCGELTILLPIVNLLLNIGLSCTCQREHCGVGVGEPSADGRLVLLREECLGACANAADREHARVDGSLVDRVHELLHVKLVTQVGGVFNGDVRHRWTRRSFSRVCESGSE